MADEPLSRPPVILAAAAPAAAWQGETREVECSLTPDDIVAFQQHVIRNSETLRSRQRGGWLAVPMLFFVTGAMLVWPLGDFSRFLGIGLIGFGAFFLLFYPWLNRRTMGQLLKKMLAENRNPEYYAVRRVTIAPDTLTQSGRRSAATWRWEAIEKIEIANDCALFFIAADNAVLLPQRSFADAAAFHDFVETARHLHRAATASLPGREM